jgi:hypothetical protein
MRKIFTASFLVVVGCLCNAQVHLLGLEAVQSVQDAGGSVPLVTGKPAVLRAYLSSDTDALKVVASLKLQSNAASAVLNAGPVNIHPNAQLQELRNSADLSLNFAVSAKLAAGTLKVAELIVQDENGNSLTCSGCDVNQTLQFAAVPSLELHIIGFSYALPNANVTVSPSDLDYRLIRSWLLRAYPISDLDFSTATLDAVDQGLAVGAFNCNTVNAVLSRIRETEVAAGRDRRTHYFGLVPDQGGFMRGCASGIPVTPDPSVVASGPSGSSAFPWDTDGSYADWYTGHELAHTFGRFHPGFCNGNSHDDPGFPFANGQLSDDDDKFVGLDMGTDGHPIALRGSQWTDVMTYCPNEWLSSYTYEAVLQRLQREGATASGVSPVGATDTNAPGGKSLSVIASVNVTKATATLQFVSQVSNAAISPVPSDSKASLEALDSADHVLFTFRVPLKLDSDIPEGQDQTALITAVIPYSDNISTLVLTIEGHEVARAKVSSEEQRGKIASLSTKQLSPASSPEFAGLIAGHGDEEIENGMLLRWKDSRGTGTTYTVQVGPSGGQLETLAVAVKRPYYVIKKRVLEAYRDKDIQIVVSANNISRSQVLSKVVHVKK